MDNLEILLLATTLQHFMQQERLLLRQSHQKKLKEPYENRQDHLAIFIKWEKKCIIKDMTITSGEDQGEF